MAWMLGQLTKDGTGVDALVVFSVSSVTSVVNMAMPDCTTEDTENTEEIADRSNSLTFLGWGCLEHGFGRGLGSPRDSRPGGQRYKGGVFFPATDASVVFSVSSVTSVVNTGDVGLH